MKHNHSDHSHDNHIPTNKVKLTLVIILNIIITVSEYIGGILSGSLALISDAGHNLSDVLALMLGYAGEKVSEQVPSTKYTFGMKRFEVLIALINALSLLIIGIYIVYEAVIRFLHPVEIDITIMIPVAIIGLIGNGLSILLLVKNRESNLNMKAAFLHLFYDTISSIAVIGGGIILYYSGYHVVDLIISLLIVCMIIWSTMDIIKESMRIFLQGTPSHINVDEILRNIQHINGIKSIHGLHIWSISSSEVFLSCHICLIDTRISSDTIILNVNQMLENKYHITHTTLQVENVELCNLDGNACCR